MLKFSMSPETRKMEIASFKSDCEVYEDGFVKDLYGKVTGWVPPFYKVHYEFTDWESVFVLECGLVEARTEFIAGKHFDPHYLSWGSYACRAEKVSPKEVVEAAEGTREDFFAISQKISEIHSNAGAIREAILLNSTPESRKAHKAYRGLKGLPRVIVEF
jgi:hypothetical protein